MVNKQPVTKLTSKVKKIDSVNTKLMVLGVIPILIVSLLLGTYFTTTRIQDVNKNLMQKGNLIAHNLAPSVEFGLFSQDKNFLSSLISPLLSDADVVSIAILDQSRKKIISRVSPLFSQDGKEKKNRDDMLSVFESAVYSTGFDTENSLIDNSRQLFSKMDDASASAFAAGYSQEPALMGWVVVTLSKASSEQRQAEIILNVMLFILLGLLISSVIAYRIALQIACPVKALTDTVSAISNGNLSARVKLNGAGEMRHLQLGVNAMAEIVQRSQQQLKQEVFQATQQLTETIAELEDKNVSLTATQSKLLKANAAKGEFLAKMSHEIRTPLTAVMGFSRLIETAETKEDVASYTRIVNRSGVQLLNIIDDILNFSKLESDTPRLWQENINLRDAMDDVLSMLSPAAKVKKIALLAKVSNEIPITLLGDAVKLSQVMINLVNNAIKFTDTGSVLINAQLVDTGGDEVFIEFEVIDTGIGVSADMSEKIFSRFSQAESDNKRSFEGVGLGLAIAKKLVELMGGQIGVDTTMASGARFWFVVPLKLTESICPQALLPVKQTVVLFDTCDVSRQALSNLMLSWKVDLFVCDSEPEMHDLLHDGDVNINVLIFSLGFNSGTFSKQLLGEIRSCFDGKIIILCHVLTENIRTITHGDKSIIVLEKPIQNQRLHHAIQQVLDDELIFDSDVSNEKEVNVITRLDKRNVKKVNKNKSKILVAEDNKYNAMLIKELLAERGVVCDCVENANAVLDAIQHEKYDCLLLDVHMPVMDGLTLASEIRDKQLIESSIPIILFTADVYVLNNKDVNEKGVNDVLYKPLSDKALDLLLQRWLPDYINNMSEITNDEPDSKALKKNELLSSNQALFDDVMLHLLRIEQSYVGHNHDAFQMHLHQLEGTLGYFQLEYVLNYLKELEVHAFAKDDVEFSRTLSHLRALIQVVSPKQTPTVHATVGDH